MGDYSMKKIICMLLIVIFSFLLLFWNASAQMIDYEEKYEIAANLSHFCTKFHAKFENKM